MPEKDTRPIYILGDIHGHRQRLLELLHTAGLTGADGEWSAGSAALWFVGDYVDNGPDGLGTIDLIRRLQQQARDAGGEVGALLGNHDVQLLAAYRQGDETRRSTERTFQQDWLANGGLPSDLHGLTSEQAHWLSSLPAAAHIGETLVMHADSLFYLAYGNNLQSLNRTIRRLLEEAVPASLDRLLIDFTQHREFLGARGEVNLQRLQKNFGGRRIVHGHTPISKLTDQPAEKIQAPYVYLDSRAVNVDGGLYLGGPGFVYELPPLPEDLQQE